MLKRLLISLALLALPALAAAQPVDATGSKGVFDSPTFSKTATLGALDAAVTIVMSGRQSCSVQIVATNLNGIISFEASVDGGTTWSSTYGALVGAPSNVFASTSGGGTFGGGATTKVYNFYPVSGVTHFRARVSTYTSGTSTATITAAMAAASTGSIVSQATGTQLHTVVDSGAITVTGGPVTVTDPPFTSNTGVAPPNVVAMVGAMDPSFNANNLYVDIGGRLTVASATGTNFHTVVDSGTITTITNPVTVTDGAGSLNVIVDSGSLSAVPEAVASATEPGTCVSVTTSNTTVLASNASRKFASIANKGTSTAFIKFGATATTGTYPLPVGAAYNWPAQLNYTGVVDAITASGTANLCVVEF